MRTEGRAVARRAAGTAAGASLALACATSTAVGVASFPAATNPAGAAAAPHPPGTEVTLRVNVPFKERPSGATPLPNLRGRGPSDVRISVPDGWTDVTCGGSRRINGGGNTATEVISWECAVEGPPEARVLHWTPLPEQAPLFGTLLAQQEFAFTVRPPSAQHDTAYGAEGSTAPGFWVIASYPDSIPTEISKPPNAPADAPGVLAPDLVRFVAGLDGPAPTPTPAPTPAGTQTITAEIPSVLAMTFATAPVRLTAAGPGGEQWVFTGALNDITVTDTRPGGLPWALSGQGSDFSGPAGPVANSAGHLGWAPVLRDGAPTGVTAGEPVAGTLDAPPGPGLATSAGLAGAGDGHGLGVATAGAALSLRLPTGLPGGTYTTTLTLTLI